MKEKKNRICVYHRSLEKEYSKIKPLEVSDNLLFRYKAQTKLNPYPVDLTLAEISLILRLETIKPIEKFIRPRNDSSTNDFYWLGESWEAKTLIGKNLDSVKYAIWRATDQKKRNIILDASFTQLLFSEVQHQIIKHLSIKKNANKIDRLLLVRGKVVIKMK